MSARTSSPVPRRERPIGFCPKVASTRLTALLVGELVMVDGCLRVKADDADTGYLIAWPPDFDVSLMGDTIQVTDKLSNEKMTWHIGDTAQMGGGEAAILDEQIRQRLPANCSGPYWLFGGWLKPTQAPE